MAGCPCPACSGLYAPSAQSMCSGPETLVPGRLRGYRAWTLDAGAVVDDRALGLRPLRGGTEFTWDVNVEAACIPSRTPSAYFYSTLFGGSPKGSHEAPSDRCQCGIYGWYDPHSTRISPGDVYGAIDVEGRVLLGQHGFRAQRATVRALVAGNSLLADWWRTKGVDVYPTLDDLLEHYPPDDVSDLIPPALFVGTGAGIVCRNLRMARSNSRVSIWNVSEALRISLAHDSSAGAAPHARPRAVPDAVTRARAGRSAGPQTSARAPRSIDPRGAR